MRDRLPSSVLIVAWAMLPVACGGGGGGESAAPPSTAAPAPAAEAPAEAASESAEGAATEGGFGVAECDEFFETYFACIDANVPEEGRAAVKQAAEMTRTSLQQSAQAGGEDALKTACTAAADAAKQSMAAYNCDW
jgi:hypothetical protein